MPIRSDWSKQTYCNRPTSEWPIAWNMTRWCQTQQQQQCKEWLLMMDTVNPTFGSDDCCSSASWYWSISPSTSVFRSLFNAENRITATGKFGYLKIKREQNYHTICSDNVNWNLFVREFFCNVLRMFKMAKKIRPQKTFTGCIVIIVVMNLRENGSTKASWHFHKYFQHKIIPVYPIWKENAVTYSQLD